MSLFPHRHDQKHDSEDLPRYKNSCCMKYTVKEQCKRCPFRQIKSKAKMDKVLLETREKRRGVYRDGNLRINYNNQYR